MAFATLAALLTLSAPLPLLLPGGPGASATSPRGPLADLAKGFRAYRAGDYSEAARLLTGLPSRMTRNRDYALYLLAESEFYRGTYPLARASFTELGKQRDSRFAALAAWRVVDCDWMLGKHSEAAAAYRRLLGQKSGAADAAVARFRLAEVAAAAAQTDAAKQEARRLYVQVHLSFPTHPLAAEAARRAASLGNDPSAPAAASNETLLAPAERLQRALNLSKVREYQAALDELDKLPKDLPPDLATERDLAMGTAKYHLRRDYAGAAALLQGVAPRLTGEKAAFAAFHGARALSRIDRDDEAIAGYQQVVEHYPSTKWAAEAQFRSGWLHVNRGRFREALPGLEATLARYGHSAFGNDAAWYLALSHFLLGEPAEALRFLDQYERLSRKGGEDVAMRVLYWRGRLADKLGRTEESRRLWHECVAKSPVGYYGLLAAARLREAGQAVKADLPRPSGDSAVPASALRDPLVERVEDLLAAGLDVEAGIELQRGEAGLLKRAGKDRGLFFLLEEYQRTQAFHRAYELAETRAGGALAQAPAGLARRFWQAAYPRAFRELVEGAAQAAGAPDLFVYAVMRKESGFAPHVGGKPRFLAHDRVDEEIPPTSKGVAARLNLPFFTDALFEPEVNIQLGAAYLGSLYKKFGQQIPLAAGAYNAGAHAMTRWCDQWAGHPLDEFVELVTYDQAREYMKRVTAIYAHYRLLYGEPFQLSLAVDAKYSKEKTGD